MVPERYKYLAVQAFRQGELSEGQLAQFLRTNRVNAREIVASCVTRTEVSPTGERRTIELPFERSLLSRVLRPESRSPKGVPGLAVASACACPKGASTPAVS